MRQRRSISGDERRRATLDPGGLEALALRYAARYATTRARLAAYLDRKLGAADWQGADPPAVGALVEKMARLGYVDDRAFAGARAASLGRRGYGAGRVGLALRAAGVEEEDGRVALAAARAGAEAAAIALARRRRLGPFAREAPDRRGRERAIAILARAGHDPALARRIVSGVFEAEADPSPDEEERDRSANHG